MFGRAEFFGTVETGFRRAGIGVGEVYLNKKRLDFEVLK